MIEKVRKSSLVLEDLNDYKKCKVLENYEVGQKCDTIFTYKFQNKGLAVAKKGLQDL